MNEFFRFGPVRPSVPLLMRAVVRIRPDKDLLTVHGYANWSYIALASYILAFLWTSLETSSPTAIQCLLLLGITYSIVCGLMYIAQGPRYTRLGRDIAGQLPSHKR
jgi:hypothetical protein